MQRHYQLLHQSLFRSFRTSNVLNKDFYSQLGVTRSASQEEIKKAYFNLAKQYHPDVNTTAEAQDKFASINTAYETIGDQQKRRIYDSTGVNGDQQDADAAQDNFHGEGSPFGFSHQKQSQSGIFDDYEKMFGAGANGRKKGTQRETVQTKGQDIVLSLEIDFMEAVEGSQKTVSFGRTDVCPGCKGTKCRPGTSAQKCSGCGGAGFQTVKQGPFMVQQMCGMCDSAGVVIKAPCITCRGKGTSHGTVKETVNIPKGVDTGVNLRVAKKGHAGTMAGDLIVQLKVKAHKYFRRDGSNIHSDLFISIGQAVLGSEVNVKTLYGDVRMKIAPGTQHDDKQKISNYGIAKLPPNQHEKGNHYVTICIVIPKRLTQEQKEAMLEFQKVEEKVTLGV